MALFNFGSFGSLSESTPGPPDGRQNAVNEDAHTDFLRRIPRPNQFIFNCLYNNWRKEFGHGIGEFVTSASAFAFGGFSTLYKARLGDDTPVHVLGVSNPRQRYVACRVVRKLWRDPSQEEAVWKEMTNELRIYLKPALESHRNIVQLLSVEMPKADVHSLAYPIFFYEFAEEGSLASFIHAQGRPLPAPVKLLLCRDIAKGLAFLHLQGFTHNDVKPKNILVFRDNQFLYVAKLCDFGFATAGTERTAIRRGTRSFSAPEVLQGTATYSTVYADVYSFGLVAWSIHLDMADFPENEPVRAILLRLGLVDLQALKTRSDDALLRAVDATFTRPAALGLLVMARTCYGYHLNIAQPAGLSKGRRFRWQTVANI